MRNVRVLGVIALVVTSICVVVVVPKLHSARADVLCKTPSNPNPCGVNTYAAGTVFNAKLKTGTTAKITTGGGDIQPVITCTASTLGLWNINGGGANRVNLSVVMTSLTFTGCTSAPVACSAAATVGNLAGGSIAWIANPAGNNGNLKLVPPTISFTCGNRTCVLGGHDFSQAGVITGGNPAALKISGWAMDVKGTAGCPLSGVLTADYELTSVAGSPTALNVEKTGS
jgi:hypothetical protein